jgi:uncharacterized protein (DUF488 family)
MIFTIGHSTRTSDELMELLKEFKIQHLVDVRTIPRSRRNPQFNQEVLAGELPKHEIGYTHLPELGGLRKPKPDSINTAWRNDSFRGYADYMQTSEFEAGLEKLVQIAANDTVVIMCAEAVPWRCHRSLIGDALWVRGIEVVDIIGIGKSQSHHLTPFAKVRGTTLVYSQDPEQDNNSQSTTDSSDPYD